MKPNLVSKPNFTVVGMKYRGKNEHEEIPQLWARFGPHMGEINDLAEPEISYGLMGNYDPVTGEFDYMAGMAVERATDLLPGMTTWEVPAQTYLVFATPFGKIREAYANLYARWLPESGYQRSGGTEFELYDEQFDPHNLDSVMYIYVPIQ